jgi:hypothetical protein
MSLDRCEKCGRAFKQSRSNNQNRYYWGVVVELLSEHTGFDREDVHEILKHRFLRRTVWVHTKHGTQEQNIITKSTTGMTTKAFEDYLSDIRRWASAELGVYLPEPNEELQEV